MINKQSLCFMITVVCLATGMIAQPDKADFPSLKKKYRDDDVVYLKYNESYTIKPDGDLLDIDNTSENEMVFMSENSSYYAQRQVSYVEMVSSVEDIEAYTMVPKEKGGYKKVNVSEYQESKNTSEDVFYDDVHSKSFTFPQPMEGAIGVLKYSEKIKDPHFLGKFYFASGAPIEEAAFTVKVHRDVDLKCILKNPKDDIVYTEVTDGKYKICTWTRHNIAKLKGESEAKSIAYETPHVILYIASYKGKSGTVKVLENTRGLYNYCYSLLDKGLEKPTPEIMRLVDSLTANAKTDEDKVKNIYAYIQENIKYIAFEDGLGGFIPRKPSLVCTRKYGDCKDISNLLCAMLNYAGVPTYHTWIGTNDIPYKFSELPIMGVANHMIASTYFNHQWYFLDGTSNFLSYRYPSDFVQGKQAMIGISPDSFLLLDIPVVKGETNLVRTTINAGIGGDTLKGSATRVVDGLPRCEVSSRAYFVSGNKKAEYWKSYLELGQNNCVIEDIVINGLKGRDSLLTINFDYKIPKYVLRIDNEVFVNLNLIKLWNDTEIELDKRTRDFIFDKTDNEEIVTVFNIPAGYTVNKLPQDYSMDKGNFGFKFTYERSGNSIIYKQKYWYNTLELDKPDFAAWNDIVNALHTAFRQTVVLKSNTQK